MPEFLSPVDIANRALQRVGSDFITSFADNSERASAVSFNYGKLRQAELERNTWTFSTRRAAIRALDVNSAILQPALWVSSTTYFLGSIVTDQAGTLWKSILRDNLGNQPGVNISAWVPYFGPVSVSLYTGSVSYFVGEIVYTAAGDGTFNVYQSQVSGNGLDPSLPNVWSNLTTYNKDWVVVVYPNWAVGTTYGKGATVLYTDNNYYTSLIAGNVGNTPPTNPADWVLTPILQLVPQQNVLTLGGTVVSTPLTPAPGLSQPLGNVPQTSPVTEWMQSTNYGLGTFVMFNTVEYVSLQNNNTGNFPGASPTFWAAITGGTSYMSLVDFNVGNAPASSPSQWTSTITGGAMNQQWLLIGGSAFSTGVGISPLLVTYPVGAGPLSQSWTKNVYMLPAGHLRKAPQDPKRGVNSWLGSPGNTQNLDWTFEGPFLVTWDSQPIVYRFIADMQNVSEFKPVFCEALACRIAMEVCEKLTQSSAKIQVIAQMYKKFMTEAITIDAIETGAIEPPLDDLIATRL